MYSASYNEFDFVLVEVAENMQHHWVAMSSDDVFNHYVTNSLEEAKAWVMLKCFKGYPPLP